MEERNGKKGWAEGKGRWSSSDPAKLPCPEAPISDQHYQDAEPGKWLARGCELPS